MLRQRKQKLEKKKVENLENEKQFLDNKALIKNGKNNPWETVVENIALKESEYKGNNDVTRMRTAIISRKNDTVNNQV